MPATHQWNPARTWLFVVGTLSWKHADMFDPFPVENRRDAALVELLLGRGVPSEQVCYLQDKEATQGRIDRELASHLKRARAGDFLLLYYCGHGYKDDDGAAFFAPYDAGDDDVPGWAMASILPSVEEQFAGAYALLTADCCYSGCLADAIAEHEGRVAFACLFSSSASELSTGNWTFTEALLAAFGGECFTDADGSAGVTLQELARQVQGDMAFAEEQRASFVTAGRFDPQLMLGPARRQSDPQIGRRVDVESEGDWYAARVIGVRDGELLVRYFGYEPSDDEWVTPDRVRERPVSGYVAGDAIEVRWKGEWYAATVLEVRNNVHLIHYDGFDSSWNEWVSKRRMRRGSPQRRGGAEG